MRIRITNAEDPKMNGDYYVKNVTSCGIDTTVGIGPRDGKIFHYERRLEISAEMDYGVAEFERLVRREQARVDAQLLRKSNRHRIMCG